MVKKLRNLTLGRDINMSQEELIKFIKKFVSAVKKRFFPDIDDETKDTIQNLELKEDGYLYLGIY